MHKFKEEESNQNVHVHCRECKQFSVHICSKWDKDCTTVHQWKQRNLCHVVEKCKK